MNSSTVARRLVLVAFICLWASAFWISSVSSQSGGSFDVQRSVVSGGGVAGIQHPGPVGRPGRVGTPACAAGGQVQPAIAIGAPDVRARMGQAGHSRGVGEAKLVVGAAGDDRKLGPHSDIQVAAFHDDDRDTAVKTDNR